MRVTLRTLGSVLLAFVLPLSFIRAADDGAPAAVVVAQHDQFWRDTGDIASLDLFYGPGGKDHQPHGPYTFVKEDLAGSNPKFVVKDRDGIKWKVKLGAEARPETAATRFVWAAGYFANEDYFLTHMQIADMPAHLHRGQKLVLPGGVLQNVRLKREDEKKEGEWKWRQDPFTGTREWYGLRVLMAVINNWDLKDVNNAVYQDGNSQKVYLISDLGASFGTARAAWPLWKAKGNAQSYTRSKLILRTTPQTVNLADPGHPEFVYFLHPRQYFSRIHMEWIGRNIPREDCRWMGNLLSQLSHRQIEDAFRAAGYSAPEVQEFATVLENRIAQLSQL